MNLNSPKSLSAAIGVFDSGLGGLTIVRALRQNLPHESIVYFGDIARLPYGTKSRDQIRRFSRENTEFLLKKRVKALVIACNSSSSAAYSYLKKSYRLPMIDVITPAVEEAVEKTRSGRIGVIGTHATIESKAYERALSAKNKALRVYSRACPLFVPIVEEGMVDSVIGTGTIAYYLKTLKKKKVDTVILGCTHYPMMKRKIQEFMGRNICLVDSAGPCSDKLRKMLEREALGTLRRGPGKLDIYVSDLPRNFVKVGERFLKERLGRVKIVR